MVAPDFSQINRAERDKLSRLLGSSELAQRFWDEVVRSSVDAAEDWGMRPGSEIAKSTRLRYGKPLQRHMKKVADRAAELRSLLDEDTLQRLALPPSDVLRSDDLRARTRRNIERVRDLRRLLDELVSEIEIPRFDWTNGEKRLLTEWEAVERPLPFRLDFYLAMVVDRWIKRSPSVVVRPEGLLDVVFIALNMSTNCNGSDSIRGARDRRLIP